MIFMPNISLIFALLFISVVGARVGNHWELCRSKSGKYSEYCCCKEIVEVTGKFTWLGKNVEYILNHPDFNAMTKEK
jgi:hypothetical protein